VTFARELGRPGKELGEQQVLPLRGELDEAERFRAREPGVPAEPQCVVLLLHQAADALERLLIFQTAVPQLPAEFVPGVRVYVRTRIELAE
jgi:hypothetical protein